MESDPELDPDPLVRGTDPDPHQNVRGTPHLLQLFFLAVNEKIAIVPLGSMRASSDTAEYEWQLMKHC